MIAPIARPFSLRLYPLRNDHASQNRTWAVRCRIHRGSHTRVARRCEDSAQTVAKTDVQDSLPAGNGNGKHLKQTNPLPVTQVVLFNSGVGYFQRLGRN